MIEQFGYPQITEDIKQQIFGLNAARLYNVDPDAVRCTLPTDQVAKAKAVYAEIADPSLRTYGPRTRREFLATAFHGRSDPRRS